MPAEPRTPLRLRIVIQRPVPGVRHSLQSRDDAPLDPQQSLAGEPLAFDVAIELVAGQKFFGDQVRREGPLRRFVYVRVGTLAGDHASPWTRRMKIDIHDLDRTLLDAAVAGGRSIEIAVDGTGRDGTPACATVPPIRRRLA